MEKHTQNDDGVNSVNAAELRKALERAWKDVHDTRLALRRAELLPAPVALEFARLSNALLAVDLYLDQIDHKKAPADGGDQSL